MEPYFLAVAPLGQRREALESCFFFPASVESQMSSA